MNPSEVMERATQVGSRVPFKHETRAQKLQRVAGVMWMPAAVAAVAYLMMIVKTPAATVLPASS